jgi:hypothetical protein
MMDHDSNIKLLYYHETNWYYKVDKDLLLYNFFRLNKDFKKF